MSIPNAEQIFLHYDHCPHGAKRLIANSKLLRTALNGFDFELWEVNRANSSRTWASVEDHCLIPDVEFDGVVINGLAKDAQDALEAAQYGFTEAGYDTARILWITHNDDKTERPGITTVKIPGGNGYLTDHDATAIAEVLQSLGR